MTVSLRLLLVLLLTVALAGCTGKQSRNKVDEYKSSEFGQKKAETDAKRTGLGTKGEISGEDSTFVIGEEDGLFSGMSGGKGKVSREEMRQRLLFAGALDVVMELPILISDQTGGFISTDWKINPNDPKSRYRLNIRVSGKEPYGEVKVVVLKQELEGNTWKDTPADTALAAQIEKAIRKRATTAKDKAAPG